MSISGSLSNALTGLAAATKAAELVSSNVANALTEGYGRREIALSARVGGGAGAGVQIDGVTRAVDRVILRDRRLADAAAAGTARAAGFQAAMLDLLGTPGAPDALSTRIGALEAALIEASGRPDIAARLDTAVQAAKGVADGLNRISDGLQSLRMDADATIARRVAALNRDLAEIETLNGLILRHGGTGRDVSSLLDQRQQAVDRIAPLVPLRVLSRDNGTIALYSQTGAALLDAGAATVGFAASATITADMTLAGGALSGLTINGRAVATSGANGPLSGGELEALFAVRDALAPAAQDRIDAVARDLYERFADPAVDPTLAPGQPGLFSDAGAALDPADTLGFAGRISVSAAADPAAGGASWRLRDGLGAAAPGPAGATDTLNRLAAALTVRRMPPLPALAVGVQSAGGLVNALESLVGSARSAAEQSAGFASARRDELREMEFAGGVDTDTEMQKLLVIERAYAANAQVIRTVDELSRLLLGL